MTEASTAVQALAQHPPAVKVGGRRLSVNARHKPSVTTTASHTTEAAASSQVPEPASAASEDYPRPSAHTQTDAEVGQGDAVEAPKIQQQHHEREKEKEKDKHHKERDNHVNLENKLKRRAEENTRPTKDVIGGGKGGFGAAGRIAQPVGKFSI